MDTKVGIDWTNVVNLDDHGTFRGYATPDDAEFDIEQAKVRGRDVDERYVADRAGLLVSLVRITDDEFGVTAYVFPAECDNCGAPVTSPEWVTDEHHAKCPRRDPHF